MNIAMQNKVENLIGLRTYPDLVDGCHRKRHTALHTRITGLQATAELA
jgi:hypothetical protein